MGIGWLRVLCLGALGASLAANDYTAEIANGGLRARQETHVVMRSERLLISQTKIRVEYEFLNESPAPVETVVAFPWPGYAWSAGAATYSPEMWEFLVEVDGVRVAHQTEIRARVRDRDVTALLAGMGLHIPSFGHFDDPVQSGKETVPAQLAALSPAALEKLKKVGALNRNGLPKWMTFLTHYWSQRFPPGRVVRVVHEYTPMPGGSAYGDLAMIQRPKTEGTAWRSLVDRDFDAREPGCPDEAFSRSYLARRRALLEEAPELTSTGLGFSWVRYILTTANTWKGPIRDFELIVERNPDELVTFCWDGPVEKVGADRFRAARKDFRPGKELTVYFVRSLKRQQ